MKDVHEAINLTISLNFETQFYETYAPREIRCCSRGQIPYRPWRKRQESCIRYAFWLLRTPLFSPDFSLVIIKINTFW
jgi:hypothetical protein